MNAVPHVLGDLRNPQETDDAESDDGQAREEARPRRAQETLQARRPHFESEEVRQRAQTEPPLTAAPRSALPDTRAVASTL
jgi:hypothetical protein